MTNITAKQVRQLGGPERLDKMEPSTRRVLFNLALFKHKKDAKRT